MAISPLFPRLTTEASATMVPSSARPVPSGQDTAGATTAARGATVSGARDRRRDRARGAVRGVPRAVTRANAAEEEAMSALVGSGVAM